VDLLSGIAYGKKFVGVFLYSLTCSSFIVIALLCCSYLWCYTDDQESIVAERSMDKSKNHVNYVGRDCFGYMTLPFLPLASYPESQNFNNVQCHMGSIEKDTMTNWAWSLLYCSNWSVVHLPVAALWKLILTILNSWKEF